MRFHQKSILLLSLFILIFTTISCPSRVDDVNVREAFPSGIDYSFVIWEIDLPRTLTAGQETEFEVELLNNGLKPWTAEHGFQYFISYHWKHPSGKFTDKMFNGLRTPLPTPVHPGEMIKIDMKVMAPDSPKFYDIVIDIVRAENDSADEKKPAYWFESHDERNKPAFDKRIDVVSR